MRVALEAAGLKVEFFTGDESPAEREALRKKLELGNADGVDVLVGTSAVATGVDGLQHVCSHIMFNGMACRMTCSTLR